MSAPARGLRVLTADTDLPVVTQTSVVSNLLKTLEIVTQRRIQLVGHHLRKLAILDVVLTVQEPVRDTELSRVGNNHHERFQLRRTQLTRALTEVNFRLFAHQVGKTAADPANLRQRVHNLLATIDVGVQHTNNVLKVIANN